MDVWSPAVEGILSLMIRRLERSTLCRVVFQPSLLFEAIVFTIQHSPRAKFYYADLKEFNFLYNYLDLPESQICQGIPRGMRCLAGHRRGRRLSSRLRYCLRPPIACCEDFPRWYHQLRRLALRRDTGFTQSFLLRLKLKVAGRDVDPQVHYTGEWNGDQQAGGTGRVRRNGETSIKGKSRS